MKTYSHASLLSLVKNSIPATLLALALMLLLALGAFAQQAFAEPSSGSASTTTESASQTTSGSANGSDVQSADQGSTTQTTNQAQTTQTTQATQVTNQATNAQPKPAPKPTKKGWLKDSDGTWYYFTSATSAPKTGWLKSGGKWYYLDPAANGAMKTGKYQVVGKWYISNGSGAMYAKKWVKLGSDWYYATKSGALKTGWHKSGGKWYYLDPAQDGLMLTGKYKVGKAFYASNSSGAMYAKKWVKLGSDWYYATASGAFKSGWHKSGGKWYWLQSDKEGLMLASAQKSINGALYAFNKDGAMLANTNVDLEDNKYGFAASSGAISQIGERVDGHVILKDASGKILTGWQKLAGKWFYGEAETGIMHTGWLELNGKKYYLDASGAMATGARTIDGKKYAFSSSGALVQITGNAALDSRLINLAQSQGSLRACFNWVKNHKHTNLEANSAVMRYANGLYSLTTPWIQTETLRMMDGRGVDCYGFATTFACLAKALGYDAKVRVGHVPSRSMGWASHAWVEIYQNGTTYICDTDLQRSHPGTNFYWFTYGGSPITYRFN